MYITQQKNREHFRTRLKLRNIYCAELGEELDKQNQKSLKSLLLKSDKLIFQSD